MHHERCFFGSPATHAIERAVCCLVPLWSRIISTVQGLSRQKWRKRDSRSCTSSMRLIWQPENRVKSPSFITCVRRGLYLGLRAVFLSASADRPSVAVLYAPLGVAIRAHHPWRDAPPTFAATPQALAGAETVCRSDPQAPVCRL